MAKVEYFPLSIREGSVVVKIYRQKAKTTSTGFAYVVAWVGGDGREKKTFADLADAKADAHTRAAQLGAGIASAQTLTRSDIFELTEARALVAPLGVPLLSAVAEWVKARETAGPAVLEACAAWADGRKSKLKRIKLAAAVEEFINDKDSAHKKGTRTYSAKLKPLKTFFGDAYLDAISTQEWSRYLRQFDDAVTRNDLRKRAVTLCRWAQRHSYLPDALVPEIERTERAKETAHPIGILEPMAYHNLLHHFLKEHPRHLAALVIAGLCGVRQDEVHGKRDARDRRQLWSDIHLDDRNFMSVTVAKANTPSHRIIHLSDAAVAWLSVCPGDHRGPVCTPGAMERVREIGVTAGFELPENCFRHSWITYRIALTGNKHETATEAGNSVKEIDRRYRVPRPKADGVAWFSTRPSMPPVNPPTGDESKTPPPSAQSGSPGD